jgi:hypothetical protein
VTSSSRSAVPSQKGRVRAKFSCLVGDGNKPMGLIYPMGFTTLYLFTTLPTVVINVVINGRINNKVNLIKIH